MSTATIGMNLAIAALAGLAVGLEREWSGRAGGLTARFAGARTFMLIGLGGGIAGWLLAAGYWPATAIIGGAFAALIVTAYVLVVNQRPEAIDGTTEAAAAVTLATGIVAGIGYIGVAAGIAAVVALALREKSALQSFVQRVGVEEMRAALQFAVLALVVLPLLPTGPYGPFDAVRPRALWTFVLLFSGLNFIGYLARRAFGERGYVMTGAICGLVSSTVVALTFARASQRDERLGPVLSLGIIAAGTLLFGRALVIATFVNPIVAGAVVPFFAAPFALGCAIVGGGLLAFRRKPVVDAEKPAVSNPLGLTGAIQLTIVLQAIIFLMLWARATWGGAGIFYTAAVVGLVEPDGVVLSVARLNQSFSAVAAAAAIAIGVLANTIFKCALVVTLGAPFVRRAAGAGLALLAFALGASIALLAPR